LLWNMIYFTEHISKMVHIRNNWRSHTTQHFLTLQKGQFNEHIGWRNWNENRANMRIKFPGLWDLILLQVTKRQNVVQKCAVKSWFAIHLLYSGKYYKGDVTYIVQNGRLHLVSKTYDTYMGAHSRKSFGWVFGSIYRRVNFSLVFSLVR